MCLKFKRKGENTKWKAGKIEMKDDSVVRCVLWLKWIVTLNQSCNRKEKERKEKVLQKMNLMRKIK